MRHPDTRPAAQAPRPVAPQDRPRRRRAPRRALLASLLATASLLLALAPSAVAGPPERDVRVATFNASLNRFSAGALLADLQAGSAQARNVAEIVQRVRPDILLVNEFDYDPAAAEVFRTDYLGTSQGGQAPLRYPYVFIAPSNTGVPSGFDLDNDGAVGGPNDAFGFGFFPGQFGMVVYSRFPIITERVRTFQNFLWADMPGALLPDDPATPQPADWYSPAELEVVRLSSKSHWDVPIDVGGAKPLHLLASHPTPPVFDGPEDRNGRRNHDEIRLWKDYVHPARGGYLVDDRGRRGGLVPGEPFVVVGDQNADPFDGDSVAGAIQQLLRHPRIDASFVPTSAGAAEDALQDGGANVTHVGPHAADTADFGDRAPGNLRVDYVLPSKRLRVLDGGVFWPPSTDPLSALVGDDQPVWNLGASSDHRLVWLEVAVPGTSGRR